MGDQPRTSSAQYGAMKVGKPAVFVRSVRSRPWRYGNGFAADSCAATKATGTASSSISIPPMADADQL